MSQILMFQSQHGDSLSVHLDGPAQPVAHALFVHCLECTKDLKAAHAMSRALIDAGIAVARFDFTGGELKTFSAGVADVVAASQALAQHYQTPELLIGHSLGGAAVLMAARQLASVRAVATIGAPADLGYVYSMLESKEASQAELNLAGHRFKVNTQFLEDLAHNTLQEHVAHLRRPLMIFHSPIDATIGIDNAARIFQWARHPKSFISLDQADHFLSREEDGRYIGQLMAGWAGHYLSKPDLSPGIHARTEQGYRTDMIVKGFRVVADEPLNMGGTNTGPTPVDYLSAALAACTSMTLRMYADRKKLPVEHIDVSVKHSKKPVSEDLKIDHFKVQIAIKGDIDAASRARMLEISERCPVHRILASEVSFQTELVD